MEQLAEYEEECLGENCKEVLKFFHGGFLQELKKKRNEGKIEVVASKLLEFVLTSE